ncbi:MBL fold metallo-hydrolase [Phytohabitans rumicis]|uniref:MBL fold metallo-hydrolase n=1 Tax=Phytohabitans rumicis TaxID=1076125 RepID=A0A6V8L9R0_9ACTN|nr:MBL fold metallo-hydrolase [Phytohabitans rumicis]GFJ90816.1 MBL fold metallo-hydrolase [Phytohabitans rumicis]
MVGHVTAPAAALADRLPSWVTLVRAPNPGPMTLDGTNTWVLRAPGAESCVVIDPGPLDEAHLRAVADHGPVGAVLVTHGHPDHVEGLARFVEMTGAGDTIAGLTVTRVLTPGHTADSVCFLVEAAGERVIFTGDTILGRGTTVVAWPDGDLGDYLGSLATLTAYQEVTALPGHGPALADCAAAARFYLAHRRARLDQVKHALSEGARSAQEVVAKVYADVDRSLWPAAEWSVRAQLAYLDHDDGESTSQPVWLDSP